MEPKEWVKAARSHAGLTIEQLAGELGRSKAAAGFWETGSTKPSYAQVKKISEITGYAMPDGERLPVLAATDTRTMRPKLWPYPRINYEKFVGLSGTAARSLENAILATAGDVGVDIRHEREVNPKSS